MTARGTDQRQLTDNPAYDGYPRYSPDGSTILFESIRDGQRGIWLMDADGANQRRIAAGGDGSDWFPACSPDGSRVAFSSDRDGGLFRIYVADADGLQRPPGVGRAAHDWAPEWSPDGRYIGFLTNRDGHTEMYAVDDLHGATDAVRLTTTGDGDVTGFSWAPMSLAGSRSKASRMPRRGDQRVRRPFVVLPRQLRASRHAGGSTYPASRIVGTTSKSSPDVSPAS